MDVPFQNHGDLTGDAAKVIIAAPSFGQVVVPADGISFYNADSVAHDFILQKNKATVVTVIWKELAVPAGTHVVIPKKIVLDADDLSLEALTDADATTTEPTFDVAAGATS